MTAEAPLLTLIVPTYNRAANLGLLLRTLQFELQSLQGKVAVVIGDNASVDTSADITRAFAQAWPDTRVLRHPVNIGPEKNFLRCVECVSTRYFWLIGDDDLPKTGVLAQVVELLQNRDPALVYLNSEWLNPVTGPAQGEPVGRLQVRWMDAPAFASEVHVWFTFISGMVVNREKLMHINQGQSLTRFDGTSLVQLGWTLPLLNSAGPFAFVQDRCILATKDNSGGYAPLRVFGANFANIVQQSFGADNLLSRRIIRGHLLRYLPGLIWGERFSKPARDRSAPASGVVPLEAENNLWTSIRQQLGAYAAYWLLIVPLGRFPRALALPFYQLWRVYHRLVRECSDRRGRGSNAGRPQ